MHQYITSSLKSNLQGRGSMRPHSSHNEAAFKGINPGDAVPIQCQYCPAQAFRRSRLRPDDFKHLIMMRYPVRCLRCSQRQLVSFTVAALSIPSYVKQRRARLTLEKHKNWSEPDQPEPGIDAHTSPDSHHLDS